MSQARITLYNRAGHLRCPDCTLRMAIFRCDDTFLHKCIRCHGVWFEERKIGSFRRALERFDFSQFEILSWPGDTGAYVITGCPRCRQVMEEFRYGYNTDVRLHRCGRCRGLWMPLAQMIQLMDTVKTGHAIAPDLRGWLREMRLMELEWRWWIRLTEWAKAICRLGFER